MPYENLDCTLKEINFQYIQTRKGTVCDNIICFDIETTSAFWFGDRLEIFDKSKKAKYYKDAVKIGLCYAWAVAIEYNVFRGRSLEDFMEFLDDLSDVTNNVKKICFVHNLAFEMQFLRNIMFDIDVFARKVRKPIYFRWRDYEFRCSYMLTRLGLGKWAESKKLAHRKLMGDLDYNVMRTPLTQLNNKQWGYIYNDVLVMVDGLTEYKERYGTVETIPITQTAIVRREYNALMRDQRKWQLKMRALIPETLEEYQELVKIFGGGVTRGNRLLAGMVLSDVWSRDEASAYPWAMLSKKYPLTKFVQTKHHEQFMYNDDYSYIITVELWKISSKLWNTYLSKSKCATIKGGVFDNGRIISADYVKLTTTNIDYEIILQSYDIKEQNIIEFKYALNSYLHPILCMYILDLYQAKTELRDVEEFAALYAKSKENLNALFGMACTKTISDEVSIFNNEWKITTLDQLLFDEKITKQKRNLSKINLSFAAGCWIPAYQRQSLWGHLLHEKNLDEDTVYMDTDSNKHINHAEHDDYFEKYNEKVREEQEKVAERLGVDVSRFRPVQPDGKICSIGEYEVDAKYKKFITQGSKRYCYELDDGLHITVSGVSKSAASQLKTIEEFEDGLIFDVEHAKKNILFYNDEQPTVTFCEGKYDEYVCSYQYGVCLQPTSYKMSLTGEYSDLLKDIAHARTELFFREC